MIEIDPGGKLSAKAIRQGVSDLKRHFPNAKTIGGTRIENELLDPNKRRIVARPVSRDISKYDAFRPTRVEGVKMKLAEKLLFTGPTLNDVRPINPIMKRKKKEGKFSGKAMKSYAKQLGALGAFVGTTALMSRAKIFRPKTRIGKSWHGENLFFSVPTITDTRPTNPIMNKPRKRLRGFARAKSYGKKLAAGAAIGGSALLLGSRARMFKPRRRISPFDETLSYGISSYIPGTKARQRRSATIRHFKGVQSAIHKKVGGATKRGSIRKPSRFLWCKENTKKAPS